MSVKRVRNKDLAQALDITENSVYRLRKSDEMPRLTPQRLEGICEVLRCQPGDLLKWIPDDAPGPQAPQAVVSNLAIHRPSGAVDPQGILVQKSIASDFTTLPRQTLRRLTEFHVQILALSWQGYKLYGPGAVVFSDPPEGPQIAYVEKTRLADPNCQYVIDHNRPELSAVVLYYPGADYTTSNYEILTLTGPHTPPDCFRDLYQEDAP